MPLRYEKPIQTISDAVDRGLPLFLSGGTHTFRSITTDVRPMRKRLAENVVEIDIDDWVGGAKNKWYNQA